MTHLRTEINIDPVDPSDASFDIGGEAKTKRQVWKATNKDYERAVIELPDLVGDMGVSEDESASDCA